MKTGYHAVYAKDFFQGIDDAYMNGFDFVQFDLGVPTFFLNDLNLESLINIRDYAKDKKVEITFHAPGDNVSLFCANPLIRQGIIEEFKLILEKANILNARHITIHAGEYSLFKRSGRKTDDFYLSYYEEIFYENVRYICENCGDVLICIENFGLNENKRKMIKKLLDDKISLFLTMDIAKLFTRACEVIYDDYIFFNNNRQHIREIHIHDFNEEFRSHQIVGSGNIDFAPFKKFCNDNIYLNFEVRPVEAATVSKNKLLNIWA